MTICGLEHPNDPNNGNASKHFVAGKILTTLIMEATMFLNSLFLKINFEKKNQQWTLKNYIRSKSKPSM